MLSGLLSAGQMARAGAVRILELLDTRSKVTEPSDPEPIGAVRGAITFEDVRFAYDSSEGDADPPPLLDGFTLRIEPGERATCFRLLLNLSRRQDRNVDYELILCREIKL